MLGETPKVLFLHWAVTGKPTDIINQAKQIIMQTSTYQNLTGPTRTPTSAGPIVNVETTANKKIKSVGTRPSTFSVLFFVL